MMIRILFFVAILSLTTFAPFGFLLICALVYALYYTAYELIVLAVFLDAFYGLPYELTLPYYTLGTSIALICIEWMKPRISVYNA